MAHDFLWLYHGSYDDAVRLHETELWEKSFRENVACARAIEKALRGEYAKTGPLPPDCAAKVLEEYGFNLRIEVLIHKSKFKLIAEVVRRTHSPYENFCSNLLSVIYNNSLV